MIAHPPVIRIDGKAWKRMMGKPLSHDHGITNHELAEYAALFKELGEARANAQRPSVLDHLKKCVDCAELVTAHVLYSHEDTGR